MKLKIMLAAIFVAGLAASIAIAQPPPGHGNPHAGQGNAPVATTGTTGTTTTGTTTTSTSPHPGHSGEHGHAGEHGNSGKDDDGNKDDHPGSSHSGAGKVLLCHKTGHGWVLISVSANSAHVRKNHGDTAPANGKCPSRPNGRTGTTTTGTTTTGTTTTAATTTIATTTTGTTTTG
jgi:hypothetical protein